jgi:hypothetical protein
MTNHYQKSLQALFLALLTSTSWGQNIPNQTQGVPQELIHYWNFNNSASFSTLTVATSSVVNGAALNAVAGGTSVIDFANGTGQNFDVQNLNARNSDVAGTHLRFNNPIGGALVFNVPTTGFDDVIVKFATRRSSSGAGTQSWYYSTNGSDYTLLQTVTPNNGDPALASLDFSAISAADNNANFKLKVEFSETLGGTGGNNRFDNFTVEGITSAAPNTTAPTVAFTPTNSSTNISTNSTLKITFNENIRLTNNDAINNTNVDALVELRLNDALGTLVSFDATINGKEISIVPNAPLLKGQLYYVAVLPNVLEDENNNALSTTESATFTTANTSIALKSTFITVNENSGDLNFELTLTSPSTSSIDLVVKGAPFTTADDKDFTLVTKTLTFDANSNTSQIVTIPIIDDTDKEQQAEYFVLSLENANGITVTGTTTATIYIKDNDRLAPVANNAINLNYIGSFDPSGANTSTCEIVVHDPDTQKLFTTSAIAGFLDVIDFIDPTNPTVIKTIDMNPYGGVTSVAVKNGILAVASPNDVEQLDGSVVFFNTNGDFIKQVTVGALPDMITFTPDGTKVMTANEGQPSVDYTVDPEGSVSIIDLTGGVANLSQFNVTTLYFSAYNAQEANLMASGVRKVKSTSTLSQDFEPEYITIDSNSNKAWVALQENNAIAEINLTNNTISSVWALGTKDISKPGNGFDVSDNNGQVLIANWPVQAFFIPDAIANYTANGTNYIVTANEGDEKEYGAYTERVAVSAMTLDPAIFPNAAVLKQNNNLGRFRATNANGNTDADAEFETINCVGTRSFSIFDTTTKQIVYDSGDDFEMYTASNYPTLFNTDHTSSNTIKNRSRAKGPEPEGVTTAVIGNKTFAFISLERVGGVMVYDVTDPNIVQFVDYKNSRSTSAYAGDNGPEGITYIAPEKSATGKGYILVANEVSGTITIFEVNMSNLGINEVTNTPKTFTLFPNPSGNGIVYFNRVADYELYDYTGKLIQSEKEALTINTASLKTGIYLVKTSEGMVQKLIVK